MLRAFSSARKSCLFVHIQKTGGSSISRIMQKNMNGVEYVGEKHSGITRADLRSYDRKPYSFAFVRNPWDRMVSWHSMIVQARRAINPWYFMVREHGALFEKFVMGILPHFRSPQAPWPFEVGQLRKIIDREGKIIVDFVGRYEDFDNQVEKAFEPLGIKPPKIPHKNKSHHGHYSDYYTNNMRDTIGEIFQDEIDYFGYRFDDRR